MSRRVQRSLSYHTLKLGTATDVVASSGSGRPVPQHSRRSAPSAGLEIRHPRHRPGASSTRSSALRPSPSPPVKSVHSHNLVTGDFECATTPSAPESHPSTQLLDSKRRGTFQGIIRSDGRVATRNYVGIITTVNCSPSTAARRIAATSPTIVMLTASSPSLMTGCGMAEHGNPPTFSVAFLRWLRHPSQLRRVSPSSA